MNPTLKDGEVVLVDREAAIEVGDIVVAKHPFEQDCEVVKRVERVNERGHYFLVGDKFGRKQRQPPFRSSYKRIYQRESRRPSELKGQVARFSGKC